MSLAYRNLIRGLCVLSILLGPFITGAVPGLVIVPFLIVGCAISTYAQRSRSDLGTKITLAILSVAVTITAFDLGLRFFHFVPDDLIERWPPLPLVNRYVPNINSRGHRFSDLARMSGHREWIEPKSIRLITDATGFRNERLDVSRPLDVILLGDSFAAGAVSQEDTWSSIWTREHQLNTYNLSTPASGPWHEYVNLWAESERLKTRKGTNLIWQIFAGNDLDDCYGSLEPDELPWSGSLKSRLIRLNSLRGRSPIRYFLQRHSQTGDVRAYDFPEGRKILFYRPYLESSSRSAEQIVRHPNYQHFLATILAVKRFARSRDLRLSIVLVPAKEEVYSWVWKNTAAWSADSNLSGFSVALRKICVDESITYLDLKPFLVQESYRIYEQSRSLLYWYDDTHLNSQGSRFAGKIIFDELIKEHQADDIDTHLSSRGLDFIGSELRDLFVQRLVRARPMNSRPGSLGPGLPEAIQD